MMRTFALTLLVLGVVILVAGGFVVSALVAFNRRRDRRMLSAHDTALRFRRRYGPGAGRAVARLLGRAGLSARKHRFYRTVASELMALDALRGADRAGRRAAAVEPAADGGDEGAPRHPLGRRHGGVRSGGVA